MTASSSAQTAPASQVGLRILALSNLNPLTGQAAVGLLSVGRKGCRLLLQTPFIDGCHVMMDVHNITPKVLEVSFYPGDDTSGEGGVPLLGQVAAYRRQDEDEPPGFSLEVTWMDPQPSQDGSSPSLAALVRKIKRGPE